ncbi:TPA: hypothetical protein EYP70_05280 [Candidatus Bathyarchaeota archaeon]|nr:hypothetical protein [Candidatus Bathyarchaeota archaeon]
MIDLKHKIDERLDELIEMAKELVENTGIYEKVEESQIRNILNMASAVDSVKVLEIFIQYQMGRRRIPKEFGDKLVENVLDLEEWAKGIADDESQRRQAWLHLVRLYLGYLNMYFVYKRKIWRDKE